MIPEIFDYKIVQKYCQQNKWSNPVYSKMDGNISEALQKNVLIG